MLTKFSKLLILFIVLIITKSYSQDTKIDSTYKITVKIKDLTNAEIYLGYHFGSKKVILDTTFTDKNGVAIFSGNNRLKEGIYIIAFPSKHFFEIIVDKDQVFEIETDTINYVNSMKVHGSVDNEIFNKYQRTMQLFQIKTHELNYRIRNNKDNNDSIKILSKKLKLLQKDIRDTWIKESEENKGKFYGKLIKSMIEPEFPKDSATALQYYKTHYWDNIDLTDDRLLRTPIIETKLNRFLNNAIGQHPDSIVHAIDKLISLTQKNDKVYSYFVMNIINYYEASNAFAMDNVFIYLAEKYIINNAEYWNNPHFIDVTNYKLKIKKAIVTGSVAPKLNLTNTNNEKVSLYDLSSKLTVIYFWEPDCGYCAKATPIVHDLYLNNKDILKVYAVNCGQDKDEWIKYLNENKYTDWVNVYDPHYTSKFQDSYDIIGTPAIYFLDENKRIIAKKINVKTLSNLLDYYKKMNKQ